MPIPIREIVKSYIRSVHRSESDFHRGAITEKTHHEDLERFVDSLIAALKQAVDEAGDVEVIKVIIDKALENSIAWRHIDFPDDFPYERVINEVKNDLAQALSQHIRSKFYKE